MESEKARQNRLERNRKWREQNAEKLKLDKQRFYQENREKQIEAAKRYARENPERVKAVRAARLEKKKEELRKKYQEYYEKNKEKMREKCAKYARNNRERIYERLRNRRALKRGAPGTHSKQDIERLFSLQKGKCATCHISLKVAGFHIDHITALVNGGSNWPDNLQLLCPTCNVKKGARCPVEWSRLNGLLI